MILTIVIPTIKETVPADPTTAETAPAGQEPTQKQKQRQKETDTGNNGFKEMPYTFVSANDPTVESCLQVVSSLLFPTPSQGSAENSSP
jgi:hypothetical protein